MSRFFSTVLSSFVFQTVVLSFAYAQLPSLANNKKIAPQPGKQAAIQQPVRVVDKAGKPVANASITPTHLLSSQGTDLWNGNEFAIKRTELRPETVTTGAGGIALLDYPFYADVQEGIHTTAIYIEVDHPDFARPDIPLINLPVKDGAPYEVRLDRGTLLELTPTMDGRPSGTDGVYALWSDGRAFDVKWPPQATPNMALLLPRMKSEKQSVRLAKFDGDKVTHLSPAINCDLAGQDNASLDVPLKPVIQFKGMLDSSVPRPIVNGRVQAMTIPTPNTQSNRVPWRTWSAVEGDGSFTIDAWPQDEPIQVIAICDGYVAASGDPPAALSYPFNRKTSATQKPQVFDKDAEQILVKMEPMVKCVIKTIDEQGRPLAGLQATTYPNVSWWNLHTQVYCAPYSLWESKELIKTRARSGPIVNVPTQFEAVTNQEGVVTLHLPQLPRQNVQIASDQYELPINLGDRRIDLDLKIGTTTHLEITMQAKGTEKLGEWDSTVGVIFGCTIREGHQICALPEVSAKMDQYREKFKDPKNLKDPKLLSEVYNIVADAFSKADDPRESLKWRMRANEQIAKISDTKE